MSSLRILKVHLDFPEMRAPIADRHRSDIRYWSMTTPANFEQRLLDSSTTLAQEIQPNLRQVWHFLYEFFELRWHIYHIAQVQVDGETRTELEAMTSDLYDLDVSDFWLETSYFLTELCFQWM